jgi:hypothetical protein
MTGYAGKNVGPVDVDKDVNVGDIELRAVVA